MLNVLVILKFVTTNRKKCLQTNVYLYIKQLFLVESIPKYVVHNENIVFTNRAMTK